MRALQIALENRLPVVHMLDSGGANLHLQDEIYAWAGHIFKQQCQLSAAGIPQLAVVFGYCTAGAAYTPTLCDQTIMVRERGAIFLAGPPLVKAATGEEVTTEELGGADMHTSVSGTADYAVDTEAEAMRARARRRRRLGAGARRRTATAATPEPPFHDPDELYGIIPDDVKKQFEMREVIARIVDGSLFHEFKPRYGDTMVCGWAFIWGFKVGILGNNGVISQRGRQQGGHVHAAVRPRRHAAAVPAQRDRVHGRPGVRAPRHHQGRREDADGPGERDRAEADAAVPRLAGRRATTRWRAARGIRASSTRGRTRARRSWAPEQAADTLTQVRVSALRRQGKDPGTDEIGRIRADVMEHFEATYHSHYLTSDLRDDGLIDPLDTRNTLGMSLSAVLNAPIVRTPGGVLRI